MKQQNSNSSSGGNNGHRRQTPGRRRQSRNATQSPALAAHQKHYASENDAVDLPAEAAFRKKASDSPQTPRKSSPSSLHPNSQSQAKPRASNKQRSRNAAASPIPVKSGRKTPPPAVAVTARAGSSTAYAGATFHASPAPSSLPIPSFVARSMPDSPGLAGSPQPISQEPSPPHTDSEVPTPAHRSSAANPPREESPLDIFFRADRAEKEKARRASSANGGATVFGPFSPPSQPRSPLRNAPSAAADGPFQQGRPQVQRNSTTGSPAVAACDTPVRGMGPAFSTPYPERIKAARSVDRHARVASELTPQPHHHPVVDRSEALKNFLFAGHKQQGLPTTAVATASPAGATSLYGDPGPRSARAHLQHVYGTPPDSNDAGDRRSANLLAFEDDLRRMLKLDSPISLAKPPALANAHTSYSAVHELPFCVGTSSKSTAGRHVLISPPLAAGRPDELS